MSGKEVPSHITSDRQQTHKTSFQSRRASNEATERKATKVYQCPSQTSSCLTTCLSDDVVAPSSFLVLSMFAKPLGDIHHVFPLCQSRLCFFTIFFRGLLFIELVYYTTSHRKTRTAA